ncbi:hypothetical protein HJFPF1_03994 [Paramyrothecium foliicola]|nr:hypothetical protein HJFPF1_03994 [Paramyrothecium foliicola]
MAPFVHELAAALHRRQQVEDTSDQTTQSSELSGGAIAGIVIGSIIGFLLIVWIVRSCNNGFGMSNRPPPPDPHYYHHEYDRRRGRSRHRHRSHHHHSPRRSGSGRPPVVVEKVYTTPAAPAPTYYQDPRASYGSGGYAEYHPRSRSRRSHRSRSRY